MTIKGNFAFALSVGCDGLWASGVDLRGGFRFADVAGAARYGIRRSVWRDGGLGVFGLAGEDLLFLRLSVAGTPGMSGDLALRSVPAVASQSC